MKDELLTKSELKEKLQRCCDLMKKCGFPSTWVKVFDESNRCKIVGRDYDNDIFNSEPIRFGPDIIIPKDGEAVYINPNFGDEIIIRVSKGYTNDRKLACYHQDLLQEFTWEHWRSFSDPNVHSEGWKEEWLKK